MSPRTGGSRRTSMIRRSARLPMVAADRSSEGSEVCRQQTVSPMKSWHPCPEHSAEKDGGSLSKGSLDGCCTSIPGFSEHHLRQSEFQSAPHFLSVPKGQSVMGGRGSRRAAGGRVRSEADGPASTGKRWKSSARTPDRAIPLV